MGSDQGNLQKTSLLRLAGFIAEHPLEMDAKLQDVIRLALIDTLGCMGAGAAEAVTQASYQAVQAWGEGGALAVNFPGCLPAPWAAMVNAISAHCLDFDDWEIPGNTHPSAVIFPALLAVASEKTLSGQQLATAYLAGFEVIARLGEALNFEHYDAGWHTTSSLGTLGAAAAVARALELDYEQTAHALALSVSMAAGSTRQFGSSAKAMHAGLAAKSGLMAAQLAAQGLTGQTDILEGARGYNALTAHGDDKRLVDAMQDLGECFMLDKHGLVVKPYPCCGYTHRLVDCALDIRQQMLANGGSLPAISKISATLPDFHAAILPFLQPLDRREALFSIPFCCANALLKGQLTLDDFANESLVDTEIQSLIEVTQLDIQSAKNPLLNYDPEQPDYLEITDHSDRVWRAECVYPLGAPQNPMSEMQIYQKFAMNSGFVPPGFMTNWLDNKDINQLLQETFS